METDSMNDGVSEQEQLRKSRLQLQARSLCNVLGVLKRRLSGMKTTGSYTTQDIDHYRAILDDIDCRWRQDGVFAAAVAEVDPEMQGKCSTLFTHCFDLLSGLAATAADMEPAIKETYEKLLAVNRDLHTLATKPHTYNEIRKYQAELDAIDQARVDGIFAGSAQTHVPKGQAVCSDLLTSCYELVERLLETAEDMIPEMQAVCSNLLGIWGALLKIKSEKQHTLEDIHHYQNLLDSIDSKRKDGIFCGSLTGQIPEGQAMASEMLAECYGLVSALQETAGEMSPEVGDVYHQLRGIYTSLQKMDGHVHYTLDIHRLQGMLDAIDSKRKDGVFAGDLEHVPAGQAVCSSLLHRCYKLVEKLYTTAVDGEEFYNVPHLVTIPSPTTMKIKVHSYF